MRTVEKNDLKANMAEYFRHIEETGEELIVTDHGKPVLKVLPLNPATHEVEDLFADLRGNVISHEDINTPTINEWGSNFLSDRQGLIPSRSV